MVKFAVDFWWTMLLTIFPSKRSSENLLPNFAGSSPPILSKTSPSSLWKSLVLPKTGYSLQNLPPLSAVPLGVPNVGCLSLFVSFVFILGVALDSAKYPPFLQPPFLWFLSTIGDKIATYNFFLF